MNAYLLTTVNPESARDYDVDDLLELLSAPNTSAHRTLLGAQAAALLELRALINDALETGEVPEAEQPTIDWSRQGQRLVGTVADWDLEFTIEQVPLQD